MRLLVSVRSADEVGAAVAGGADIIDVKEPARGALGAADPEVVRAVCSLVPSSMPLSLALGDPPNRAEVQASVSRLSLNRPAGEVILKLGFAGTSSKEEAEDRLMAAIGAAPLGPPSVIVAVAYADWALAEAPSPPDIVRAASRTGARGVLLDTFIKDGRDLFASITIDVLNRWIRKARLAGLLTAVAGSLDSGGIARLRAVAPDVVGVRGAACDGGRLGRVSAERVRTLRRAVDAFDGRPEPTGPTANRQTIAPHSRA